MGYGDLQEPEPVPYRSQMKRSDNGDECDYTFKRLGTDRLIQLNGGVFCYQRNPQNESIFPDMGGGMAAVREARPGGAAAGIV